MERDRDRGQRIGRHDGAAAIVVMSAHVPPSGTWTRWASSRPTRRSASNQADGHRAGTAVRRRWPGRTGLADIDLFELNEAFAAQSLAVSRSSGSQISASILRRRGSLGHPIGAAAAGSRDSAARDETHSRHRGSRPCALAAAKARQRSSETVSAAEASTPAEALEVGLAPPKNTAQRRSRANKDVTEHDGGGGRTGGQDREVDPRRASAIASLRPHSDRRRIWSDTVL